MSISKVANRWGALFLLMLLLLFNIFFTNNFVSISTLWNLIIQTFPIIIIGLGMTMVIATGGIDISIGATMAFAAAIMGKYLTGGSDYATAVLFGLGGAALFGAFNGFMIAKLNIQPIIVTLILMISGRGIAHLYIDSKIVSLFNHPFADLSKYRVAGLIPIQGIVILVFILIVYVVMKKTSFGRYVEAIGGNERVARLSGINIFTTKFLVYVIIAIFAGIATMFEVSYSAAADVNKLGRLMEIDVIAAVTVGGTAITGGKANVIGTVIGAIIIQLITITVNGHDIQYNYALVLKALVIIIALWLQSEKTE
jgi:ribose/xylose/arabinose/galactoside ABC-type transport system permease subunit